MKSRETCNLSYMKVVFNMMVPEFLNRHINIEFSRRQTEIMRGVGIMLIMLHNLFHFFPSILKESEFNYDTRLIKNFFRILADGSPNFIYDIISFLGWYGVPIFIFLSGYGLVKRYEHSGTDRISGSISSPADFQPLPFLKRNWLKLFRLMFLGVMIFLAEELINCYATGRPANIDTIIGILIPLTSLNDLIQFKFQTIPGVYWYFGLTFELYLIYAWLVNRKRPAILWTFTILCLFTFLFLRKINGEDHWLIESYLRHNFTGWMLPFAAGVWIARHPRQKILMVALAIILSLVLFLPAIRKLITWQFADVMAVVIIIAVSLIFSKIPYWSDLWAWIGRLSAYIFVCHPIVRHLLGRYVFTMTTPGVSPTITITFVYIISVFLFAILYRYITNQFFTTKNTSGK